jgi:hypothetical protein
VSLGLALVLALVLPAAAQAPGAPVTLRLALVSEGAVSQQADLAGALQRGVVDSAVVGAGGGTIPRASLLAKPIRAVGGPEGAGLGGRGELVVVAVRPPTRAAVWTEVDVATGSAGPDDVLVLEVGGELNTIGQVLDAIFVEEPGGRLTQLPVEPVALVGGRGVLALPAPFGRPVTRSDLRTRFRSAGSVDLLVIRSLVEVMVDAATTPRGRADASPHWAGEWREGDRLFVRLPVAALRAGPPRLALSWKDRIVLGPVGEGR